MGDEGWSSEKDLRLVDRECQRRGEGIAERAIRKFQLDGEKRMGETEVVRGASFANGFDFNEITQVGWFEFMQEIVGNVNNFELKQL